MFYFTNENLVTKKKLTSDGSIRGAKHISVRVFNKYDILKINLNAQ